jgi:hypothetical protein
MLWALGIVTSYTTGGLVHLLLVIAIVIIVFQSLAAAGPSDGGADEVRGGADPAPHEVALSDENVEPVHTPPPRRSTRSTSKPSRAWSS